MLVPIDDIDGALRLQGLSHLVPWSERTCLEGLDQQDAAVDAPIGYYRFHFWLNSDSHKPHHNYAFVGKHAGFVAVSVIEEENILTKDHNYRVLVRTVLGWKSCVISAGESPKKLKDDDRFYQIAASAVALACGELLPKASHQLPPESPLNFGRIHVSSELEKSEVVRSPSISSIKSSQVSGLLRSGLQCSQDSIAFSRCGSFASLADFGTPEGAGSQDLALDPARVASISSDLLVGFPKQAVHVKDSDFPLKLLELEKTLVPKAFNFDLLSLSSEQTMAYKNFVESLGDEVGRKETISYVKILNQKLAFAQGISSIVPADRHMVDSSQDQSHRNQLKRLVFILNEFIETEKTYIETLELVDKHFVTYLREDDQGKYMLKLKEYRGIFENITDHIPLHRSLLQALEASVAGKTEIDKEVFADALHEFCESKALYNYQFYFTTYEKRIGTLRACLQANPRFFQYHEDCVGKVAKLGKKGLDQILIAPIQRVPRYALLLREAVKCAPEGAVQRKLRQCLQAIEEIVQFLNTTKHKAEQTEMLFAMQRHIFNFPPEFLKAERLFLGKLSCFMVDPCTVKPTKTRLTFYICNDMLILAKKRHTKAASISHDFLLAIGLQHVQLSMTRGRKSDTTYFAAEFDIEHACFTSDLSELDACLFGRKGRAAGDLQGADGFGLGSSYQFAPKNPKKLRGFLSDFTEARNQHLLSESPAVLRFKRVDDRDIYFHTFSSDDFMSWEHRSPVAIVFAEDGVDDVVGRLGLFEEYHAVAVVQSRLGGYRFCIRTRSGCDSGAELFERSSNLESLSVFQKAFNRALMNAHMQYSHYPPFSRAVVQQHRYVLEAAVGLTKAARSPRDGNSGVKGFLSSLLGGERGKDGGRSERLSRGASVKSSPLASPSKLAGRAMREAAELHEAIKVESAMSHLHL